MNDPVLRKVIFHGEYADKYIDELEVGADSMFALFNIIFKNVFPELINEKLLEIIIEDETGNVTNLFDPEQELQPTQKTIHILPNPDGAFLAQVIYAIIVIIISVGAALLLAPKIENTSTTSSGSNFDSVDNVIGQGGVAPVLLGTRLIGSRVVSFGIDTSAYVGRSSVYA